ASKFAVIRVSGRKALLLRAVGSRCRPRPTARKPAEQAHVTALVGEIGADTATIARHLARFELGSASLTEAQRRVDTRGHPRRLPAAAKACADILAGSARSRGGSPRRAENEAAFCTDRPAGDAGQMGNRPRLSGGGD